MMEATLVAKRLRKMLQDARERHTRVNKDCQLTCNAAKVTRVPVAVLELVARIHSRHQQPEDFVVAAVGQGQDHARPEMHTCLW
jgi:hypothetical protein